MTTMRTLSAVEAIIQISFDCLSGVFPSAVEYKACFDICEMSTCILLSVFEKCACYNGFDLDCCFWMIDMLMNNDFLMPFCAEYCLG